MKLTRKLKYSNPSKLNALEILLQNDITIEQKRLAYEALFESFGECASIIINAAYYLFQKCLLKQVKSFEHWLISTASNRQPEEFILLNETKFNRIEHTNILLYNDLSYQLIYVQEFENNF
ncbi:hypothetical protein SS50377_26669 [Spironucleus salmonicida]|uniref:Uncharacterized protein n=1 Tax=Spironucleus salmonicida TaxID=348837 RepID=A0A9P8LL74_9EUKA|nr:hypothetical protein SS50377_26669 [Spironucleus salmonicida]